MNETKLSKEYRVKIGIFSGLLFATILVLFDLVNGDLFSLLKFSINTIVFGTIMGFIIRSKQNKS